VRTIALLLLLVLPGLPSPAAGIDLLVQGAVDWELQPLLRALEKKKERTIDGFAFWEGQIGKKRVVLSRTDVGPINAVSSTLVAIREYQPKVILNQGSAGGHNRKLKLFDILLGWETVDYSAFRSAHGDEGSGTRPERWQPSPHKIRVLDGSIVEFRAFPGDRALLEAAKKIEYKQAKVYTGTIGSGFQYNRELDHIAALNKIFGTDSEDMESAYVAGVAAARRIPFLAIRIISDTEWEYPTLDRRAGDYCAEFVVNLIRSLE
jgi:adenosylhomocysteine nucleosidase